MKVYRYERSIITEELEDGKFKLSFQDIVVDEEGEEYFKTPLETVEVNNKLELHECKKILENNFEEVRKYAELHPEMMIVPEILQ